MATRPVEIGPTGLQTAHNIERIRSLLGLSQREVAERLNELGRPMPSTALSKVERGDRRCDVDDLTAIALALGVSPLALLLPPVADDTVTTVTGAGEVTTRDAWDWADGVRPLQPLTEDHGTLLHAICTRPQGRRADYLIDAPPAKRGEGTSPGSTNPLAHLTKPELIHLLDDLKEALLHG